MRTDDLEEARTVLATSARIVILTGAGISTASGIPDFRGPEGVWTKDPHAEMLSTYETWLTRPDIRRAAWRSRAERQNDVSQPNEGHRALVTLEKRGNVSLVVTQNIDGLHLAAGTSRTRLVEIHGSSHDSVCLRCGHRQAIALTFPRILRGDDDPTCLERTNDVVCGGMMKSAVISFGQSLIATDLERSEEAARACDVLWAIGSTLSVYPAASLVPAAHASGATIIITNGESTPMDGLADIVLRGDINELLPTIVRD